LREPGTTPKQLHQQEPPLQKKITIILFFLFRDGTLRFSELERAVPGVTQKMMIRAAS
jgi:hypothetical protein